MALGIILVSGNLRAQPTNEPDTGFPPPFTFDSIVLPDDTHEVLCSKTFVIHPIAFGTTNAAVPDFETESARVRLVLDKAGIDLRRGRSFYYSHAAGAVVVRASLEELKNVEKLLGEKSGGGSTRSSDSAISATNGAPQLFSRAFFVDPVGFEKALKDYVPEAWTAATKRERHHGPPVDGIAVGTIAQNLAAPARALFRKAGLEIPEQTDSRHEPLPQGTVLFYNDRQGALFIRATLGDVTRAEALLTKLNLMRENPAP